MAAVFFTAAFFTAVFFTAGLASGADSALTAPPTLTAVFATLLVAATVLVFFAASFSAAKEVLPVAWVIMASVGAKALDRLNANECCRAKLTIAKKLVKSAITLIVNPTPEIKYP
ncbi:MAG TPA: hypothetical protein VIP51_09995 [Eoetvoesiella sp.]